MKLKSNALTLLTFMLEHPQYLSMFDKKLIPKEADSKTLELCSIGEKAKQFYLEHKNFDLKFFAETLNSNQQKLLKEFTSLKDSFYDDNLNNNNIKIYISQIKENVKSSNIRKALVEANKFLEKGAPPREVLFNFIKETEHEKAAVEPLNFWEAYDHDSEWDDLLTEVKELGESSSFSKGKILTIAGDTGSMKTGISIHLCLDLLRRNPTSKLCYFQKELPLSDMLIRIKSYFTLIENNKIKAEKESVDKFFKDVRNEETPRDVLIKSVLGRFYIVDANKFYTVSDIESYMISTSADIFVIDYLALMADANGESGNFNDSVQKLCYQLKSLTVNKNLVGIVLTQLKKGTVESRPNKIPMMDDMEWSGALKQVSASVIVTYYPFLYYPYEVPSNVFYLVVKKGRYGQPRNPISFAVDEKTHRFKYIEPGQIAYDDNIRLYESTLKGGKNGGR